ncbi:MAG: hypothetical protein N4A74_11740 [Carboxylicivirga sp.]|jgi:hypothetical protein|nr:hypothetical protein [Carboxylicivirga sp.]
MSEFQYYEFKSVDKALTEKERATISSWSSRTRASADGAVFTYHYRDFPQNEKEVVKTYFDAMFYTSNWGTCRLIFKISNDIIDSKMFNCFDSDVIEVNEFKDFVLLDIIIEEQEETLAYYEPEGTLDTLLPLRDNLMNGDTRFLFLYWLQHNLERIHNEWAYIDPESRVLRVPDGLNELTPALHCFIELFEINKDMLSVIQKYSAPLNAVGSYADLDVVNMSDQDKNDFLRRLLANEKNLHIKLKQHFMPPTKKSRTIEYGDFTLQQIHEQIEEFKVQRQQEESEKKEKEKLAELKKTEAEQSSLWIRVDRYIAEKNSRAYDEAVTILVQLKKLAKYKNQLNEFYERTHSIHKKYSRLSGLKSRMFDQKLLKL